MFSAERRIFRFSVIRSRGRRWSTGSRRRKRGVWCKRAIDLRSIYTHRADESLRGRGGFDYRELPPVFDVGETSFDVRGLITLGSRNYTNFREPHRLGGVEVGRKARRLHFLHAAFETHLEREGTAIGNQPRRSNHATAKNRRAMAQLRIATSRRLDCAISTGTNAAIRRAMARNLGPWTPGA